MNEHDIRETDGDFQIPAKVAMDMLATIWLAGKKEKLEALRRILDRVIELNKASGNLIETIGVELDKLGKEISDGAQPQIKHFVAKFLEGEPLDKQARDIAEEIVRKETWDREGVT